MGIISHLVSGKKGRLYLHFIVAVAIIAATFYAYSALAAVPSATPSIVNTNATTVNGVPIANASIARALDQLFGYANFSSENASFEENSTFKWLKRTLYQPQNRSLVLYQKLDGNANDSSPAGHLGTMLNGVRSNLSMNCRIDDCLSFDGVNDFVNVTDNFRFPDLDSRDWTVELWAYVINKQGTNSKSPGLWALDGSHLLYFFNEGATLQMYWSTDLITVNGVTNNTWHHFAVTRGGNTFTLFVDGVNRGSGTNSNRATSTGFMLGTQTGGDYTLNGSIDEVAIWSYNKSAAEIAADYKNSPYSAMIYKDAVAYWHFDENGGTDGFADSSGSGNNVISGNPGVTNVSGITRGAVRFSASSSYMIVLSNASLNTTPNISVSVWIKGEPGGVQNPRPIANANKDLNGGFSLYLRGATRVPVGLFINTTGGELEVSGTTPLNDSRWHHVAFTLNGTTMSMYVDGENQASAAFNGVLGGNAANITLGAGDGRNGDFFQGALDELAIYNRSLTASEVKQLYLRTWYDQSPQQFLLHPNYPDEVDNASNSGNTTLLLHFNEGTGTTAVDSSGRGSNGILLGSSNATWTNDSISGSALRFDGVDDTVEITNPPRFDGAFTMMVWNKRSSTSNAPHIYYGTNSAYDIMCDADPRPAPDDVNFYINGAGFAQLNSPTTPITQNNTWYHEACVYNGSAMLIYVNGRLEAEQAVTGTNPPDTAGGFMKLGIDPRFAGRLFNGTLDEVKIVNRSLSAAEIAAEYRKSCPFCTSDGEMPTVDPYSKGVSWQPGRYAENLTVDGNTVSYLRFDEGTGTSVNDIGLYSNDATVYGSRWTDDSVSGKALNTTGQFNTDFVVIPWSDSLNFSRNKQFTFEAWIKFQNFNNYNYIFTTGNKTEGANPEAGQGAYLRATDDGTLQLTIGDGGASSFGGYSPTAYTVLNRWYLVTVTYNASHGQMYVDGTRVLLSPQNTNAKISPDGKNNTGIGTNLADGNTIFNGTIDEVRILNRSLSAAEVLADYRKAAKGLGLLSNDYVQYNASTNFNPSEGAVEFWVKPEWNGNDNLAHVLFDTETAADFNITKTTGNDLAVFVGNPGSVLLRSSISGWTSGYWRHVAVAWNNYTSNITLLVDGSQVNSSSTAFTIPAAANSRTFTLGANGSGTSNWCNCTFSEFRISRKALSAQEINESFSRARQLYSNEFMLNRSNFAKGDSFRVEYTPRDRENQTGTPVNSSILTVVNSNVTEPTVTDFGLAGIAGSETAESVAANRASSATPLNATFLSQINITWNPSADNDSETVSYAVLINNTLVCATTATSCNTTQLPSWTSAAGAAFYIFNVTASDGEMNASTTTYAFNFDNSTPTVSIVATTAANNTFQNTTSHFINFTVTEARIDKVLLNITGPSFAGTGGNGALSSGRNITLWDKDLVGMWHFEENNGTNTTNDSSGFGHHGNVVLPNVNSSNESRISGFNSSGRFGGGMLFDGRDDFVNFTTSLDGVLNNTFTGKEITVSAWFIHRPSASCWQRIIDKAHDAEGGGDQTFHLGLGSNDIARCGVSFSLKTSGGSVSNYPNYEITTIGNDTWVHAVLVYNGTHLLGYVNTNLSYSTPLTGDIQYTTDYMHLGVGHLANLVLSGFFNGSLDEVKIWRRALTTAEISEEYNRTASNYFVSHNFSGSSHLFSVNLTNLTNGNYSHFIWVNDSSSQSATTAAAVATTAIGQRIFSVDTIAPSISLIANTPANASVLGSSFIFINTSENDAGNNHNDFSAFVDFNSSLVGYWRFEDDGDTNASDFTNYNNNGTLTNFGCLTLNCNLTGGSGGTGSGWTSGGKRGKALVFDGENDFVNTTNDESVNFTSKNFTVEAWIKPAFSGGTHTIVSKGAQEVASWRFFIYQNTWLILETVNSGGNPQTGINNYAFANNTWYHVAAVRTGDNVTVYIDGVNRTNILAVHNNIIPTTKNLVIGSVGTGAQFFNGSIDEVKVWSRALSSQEINASFQAGTYGLFRNFTGLNDGNYSYRAFVVDAAGNVNRTEARNVTVDTVAPTISFIAPTDANASFLNRTWTLVNTSTTETSEHSVFVDFNRSLVGYWRFEDDGDTNASDFSSYNNNGTLVNFGCLAADCNLTGGATRVASGFVSSGKRGKALAFDGDGDYVNVSNSASFNVENFTIEMWFNPKDADGFTNTLLNRHAQTTGDGHWWLHTDLTEFQFGYSNSSTTPQVSLASTFSKDVWAHIAVTFSRATGNVTLYKNGAFTSTNISYNMLNTTSGDLYIGSYQGIASYSFNGTIDEVKIWNRALNETEINASYSAGTYRYSKNFTGLSDGNYSYYAAVVDSAGTLVQTTNRTIYVDTVAPAISLIANTPANASVLGSSFIFINTSENDAGNNHNELSAFIDFNNSLVGYWRFEEGSGNVSVDFSGYGNNGNISGISTGLTNWTSAGKRGGGLYFNGSGSPGGSDSSNLTIPGSVSLNNISEAITMEAWVNPDRYTGSGTVMIKDGSSYLQMDTAGQVIAYFYGLTAPGYHNSGYIVPLNTWTHLAVVYNGSHVNIYRNGVENYTNASSGSITKTGLVLASDKSGVMDELKIWNRALSRQEINASFHAGNYRLFRNFSGLADGNYTYRAYSVDASGNVNRTEARNVTVDTVAPTISFIAPTGANASFLNRTWTLVNTSTTEASEHSVFVNFNGSLVGYWRFEDDGDTNASDFTSNNNNGTLVNFGCTAADCNLTGGAAGVASGFVSSGKRGKAMAFDGVGDYVSLGNPRLFGGNVSNASMAFWVKPADSWNTDSKRDFIFADIASSAGLQLSAMEDNGDLRIVAGNSSQDTVYFTDVNWNKDVWTHIGIAYNGTHFLFYQDGVLGSVNATTLRSIGESESTTATIGATSNTLNGTLDEVMIWNRALDAQEINASFKAGTYRYSKNFTGLNDGNYSYYAAVVDSAGTLVQTTNRTIYVDTKGPGVTYDAASFANATFNKFVTINVTANDTANDHNDFSAFVDFNNGLVGYWRFEEGEVNTTNRSVADFSSYGSVGNLTNFGCLELNCNLTGGSTGSGSGWTSGGKRGKALAFDGENDYVRFNNASALYLTGNHTTIEAWVYARNKSDGYFVSKDAHYRLYTDFSFDTGGADKYRVDINNGSWAVADTLYSSKLIVENKWEHVAVTFNGTRMVMYVNGEFSNSTSLIGPVREHPTDINNLTIGARKPTTSYFNGSVDEVKIWNRTLSAQEINASFNAGRYRLIANITSSDSKYADGNFTYAAYVVDAAGNVNTTGAPRLVVLDNTAPVIAAIRTFSNSSGHLFQSSNSTSAVVAYFNSIAPAATADGGGGQEAIVEVTYTDLYRSSLNGNLTFGDVPSNITRTDPTWAAYTIETGSGNATAAVYANDSANNTATATVRFILDVNDTVTTDNSSSSSTWFSTNVTINLTAVDVANGSGANRTLWCTFTAGTPACTPSVEVANPTDFRLPLNCSTGSSCQVRIRYYSLDNVSNNESGGANGGAIRESNSVNIATGGSDVQDALVNNSVIMNGSFVRNSNVTNSTVNNCRVTDPVVVRSVLFRNIDHVRNCSISDSVVIDSNLTSVVAEKKSYIDPSVVIDSVITNSSIRNSTVSFSRVENSTFCGNFSVWTAAILNNTLIDGRIVYNGSNYFGPVALSSICGGVAPSPVGSLAASPSAAKDGDNVTFTYTGAAVGYTVTISSSELFVLDNTSTTAIALNDNGTYRDAVANDAVYAANYSISPLNNQSDGNKTIVAQVFDNLGNNWTVRTNVTLDNTPPSAAIVINSNSLNTTSAPVTLNLTFSDATTLVKDCRFANEDRAFGSYEGCAVTKVWTLSGGNGLKTVVVQVRDSASNVNETNDTITLQSPATTIITPLAGEIIKGGKTVVVIAPDAAAWVTFNVTNATNSNHTWSLAGTANAITNDTSPSDGFTQTWVTTATAFANESKFNLTVISYDASGYQLSNDTEGNIEVDNNGPNITFVNPIATVYNRTINLSVTVTADARKVVFEYSPNSGLSFFPVGADEAGPDWNFLFDTTAVADGTTYVVRANATDDAGNAANASSAEFTVDNTPPVVNITSPAAGAKVSGTVSIQFTADGASRNGEVQFDGGNWIATSGSGTHSWDTASVNDSAHAIRVRANDSIANVGYSDIRTFVVDNTNPVVTITAPANNSILTGTFRIVAVAPADTRNVTFTLSGDCSATYNDLASSDGWTWDLVSASSCGSSEYAVTITARAYDAVGNTQTYGVSGVTIDNDAPEVLVINPTATTNTTHRAAIMASANASSDAQKVFFEYSPTNGSYWIALGTDFAGTDGWNITFDTTAVADGFNYKIRANATDKVGLSGTSTMAGNFTVDNTPPSINISYPVGGMVVNGTVNVSFTGGERHPMISIDGRPVVNASNLTNYSWNTSVETEGTHTVRVNDSDAAGNIGYSNTVVVKVDNTPGVVQIITPRDNALVSGNTTIIATAPDNARTLTFYFFNGSSYNTTIKADANPADGWIAPFSTVGFPDGSNYRFRVNATDELGLFIANDEVINITIDNTAPTVTLDVPNANGLYKGVVAVNASSSADTSKVRFEYRRGSGDWTVIGEAFSQPFKIDWSTTGLPDGTNYEVRANATDRAGLSANVSNANIEVDNTAPVVTINNPTAGTTISGSFNVTFTILGTIHGVQVQFDGGSWANADAGTYAWDTTAYTDATHAVRVKANDSVNNTGYSDLRIVAVDNGGAPVILLEPLSGGYKSGNVDLTVSGPGTTFNVTFNISNSTGFFNTTGNISAVTLDNDSSNGWSAVWDTTRFAEDGTYTVSVRAYSAANALLGTDSAITIEVDNLIPANVTAINVYDYPTDTDGNLVINWTSTASPDLDHYNLYRSQTRSFNASTGTLLKSVAGNTTTDNVPAGTWFYKVTSVDNVGRESNASPEANTTVDLVGPTGTMDINATYARDNDTVKFTYTGSATGFTAIVNASEMQQLDARVLHGFEALWETSNNNSLNMTLNSTTVKAGSFSNRLMTNSSGALGQNITVDLSAGGVVNLSGYNRLLLWVQANITGSILNLTFGSGNYTETGNFTVSVSAAGVWEHKAFDLSVIPEPNRSAVRYVMFNVTASTPFTMLLDDLEASNQVSLLDNGLSGDEVANDAKYTGIYNITPGNNVTDGAKTVKAHVNDGSGNFLAPQDTITVDNTPPNGTVLVNEGDQFSISRTVTLNLTFLDATSGVKDCRFSNTEPVTSAYESCQVLKVWTTTTGGGTKTVYFEVRDQAGNANVSIDSIVLDVSVPAMLITSPLPDGVVNGTINVTFSGAESTQPQISIDGGNWTNTTTSAYHYWNTTNLSEGTHGIRVRDTDAAGNIGYSETLLVRVDNIPGVVTFIQPQGNAILVGNVTVIAVAPDNTRNVSFWAFNVTAAKYLSVYNDTSPADGWNFSLDTSRYEDGMWELYANATNDVGRVFDTAVVNNLRFDNSVPTVTLIAPANGATVRGTVLINATASADVKQVLFEYSNNSGTDWQPIGIDFSPSGGWTFAWFTTAVGDASTYRVRANATDYAGLSSVGQNSADFTIDNTPPALNITAPLPGSFVSGVVDINFTGNQSLSSELRIDGNEWFNITNSTSFKWNTSAYNDGTHTLQVRNNDSVGNAGYSSTVPVIVDNTRPTVVIISPSGNTTVKGNVTVLSSTYPDTARLDFYVDNNTGSGWVLRRSDTNKADGWDFAWDTALDCATTEDCTGVRLRVNSTDAANLTSNFTVSGLEIDNAAPTVTLLYPPDSATIRGIILASAASSNDTRQVVFEYSPDSGTTWYTIGTDPSSASGWNITWDTRQVADASTFRVRANATDNAGLSAAAQNSADFTIDNVEAATTIISPKAGTVVSGNFQVRLTAGLRSGIPRRLMTACTTSRLFPMMLMAITSATAPSLALRLTTLLQQLPHLPPCLRSTPMELCSLSGAMLQPLLRT
ncbi:hypothetical protein HYV85_00555 [Candidatus Woesearchaeota archaeon]|nr:hypothetical protein [Candidatus Woesearchaeota archaeon]